jgi:hypothetical protein
MVHNKKPSDLKDICAEHRRAADQGRILITGIGDDVTRVFNNREDPTSDRRDTLIHEHGDKSPLRPTARLARPSVRRSAV